MNTINKLLVGGIFLSTMLVLALVMPGVANAQYYNTNCGYHSYQMCSGSNLYWYDSCGNQQDSAQYCQNGCSNNTCLNTYNNYNNYNNYNSSSNYTNHAYKDCVGNNIYWYSSAQTQQDLYAICNGGQVCQYGQCTFYVQPAQPIQPLQPIQPTNNYAAYYRIACNGANVSWYDSLGSASGVYKNCTDSNTCTLDSCSASKCSNVMKCDGSTCAVGSADYNTYCASTTQPIPPPISVNPTSPTNPITPTPPAVPANNQNHCGNGLCESTLGETSANCPNDCKITAGTSANSLSMSLFAKQDSSSNQWEKTAQVGSNSQVYFMISESNPSTAQIDNVTVAANIPSEIASLGNLQLNGVPFSGDIVSGINIGSVAPSTTKLITFEGKTQTLSGVSTKAATATSTILGTIQSDSVSISFSPNQTTIQTPSQTQPTSSISGSQTTSGFWEFLKRWYLWILGALVLIFLFVIVFRRFSSDV